MHAVMTMVSAAKAIPLKLDCTIQILPASGLSVKRSFSGHSAFVRFPSYCNEKADRVE